MRWIVFCNKLTTGIAFGLCFSFAASASVLDFDDPGNFIEPVYIEANSHYPLKEGGPKNLPPSTDTASWATVLNGLGPCQSYLIAHETGDFDLVYQ